MQTITSVQNPLVKQMVQLQSSARARRELGLFVTEGLRLSVEAMDSRLTLQKLLFTEQMAAKHPDALTVLSDCVQERICISAPVAKKISDSVTPQGVFCLCEMPRGALQQEDILKTGRYLLADGLQDPGNLGTIIRSCEAFGADGLILSADCPDLYSPKVLRAAMGGVFRLPVLQVPDMSIQIQKMQAMGIRILAAALTPAAKNLRQCALADGCGILIGNEGSGLKRDVIDICDEVVAIPMTAGAESLNASAAATVFLWELLKERL